MTYEEKLDLTIKEIIEAQKRTSSEHAIKIFTTKQSELTKKIMVQEVHEILLQLQDDYKIILVKDTPNELKSAWEAGIEKVDYFLIEVLNTFNDWYEKYLMGKKTNLANLDSINVLRIYDVVLDINEQAQLTQKTTVYFPLIPSLIRFRALFPADTSGFRDEYCQSRLHSLIYLEEQGVIEKFSQNAQGWDTTVSVSFVLSKFDEFYIKIKAEYDKRNKSSRKIDKEPKTESMQVEYDKANAKATYDAQKGELYIEGKKVRLNKDSFRAKLLELLLKDDKSRKKEWSWDEVIEEIEGITDAETLKANKKRFYPACDGLAKFLAQKTGINDFLLFNKSTVQLNPKNYRL